MFTKGLVKLRTAHTDTHACMQVYNRVDREHTATEMTLTQNVTYIFPMSTMKMEWYRFREMSANLQRSITEITDNLLLQQGSGECQDVAHKLAEVRLQKRKSKDLRDDLQHRCLRRLFLGDIAALVM